MELAKYLFRDVELRGTMDIQYIRNVEEERTFRHASLESSLSALQSSGVRELRPRAELIHKLEIDDVQISGMLDAAHNHVIQVAHILTLAVNLKTLCLRVTKDAATVSALFSRDQKAVDFRLNKLELLCTSHKRLLGFLSSQTSLTYLYIEDKFAARGAVTTLNSEAWRFSVRDTLPNLEEIHLQVNLFPRMLSHGSTSLRRVVILGAVLEDDTQTIISFLRHCTQLEEVEGVFVDFEYALGIFATIPSIHTVSQHRPTKKSIRQRILTSLSSSESAIQTLTIAVNEDIDVVPDEAEVISWGKCFCCLEKFCAIGVRQEDNRMELWEKKEEKVGALYKDVWIQNIYSVEGNVT